MKKQTIHEKAIRLIEGGQVDVDGHCVKMKRAKCIPDTCYLCEMDCICRRGSEMYYVCIECDQITLGHCYLELVTTDSAGKKE